MNLKRWFVWLCLAVLVVSEVLLFQSNRQRQDALAQLSVAQHDADKARKELGDIKASAAAMQGAEGDRLRRENQSLNQTITQLRNETNRLQKTNQQLTQQLTSLGATAQQQQEKLQQWEAASRQATAIVQQSQSQAELDRQACVANLKRIVAAKLQWAIEYNKTELDIPTMQDLQAYFKDGVVPVCPSGGAYTLNSAGQLPTCSIPGHALPSQ